MPGKGEVQVTLSLLKKNWDQGLSTAGRALGGLKSTVFSLRGALAGFGLGLFLQNITKSSMATAGGQLRLAQSFGETGDAAKAVQNELNSQSEYLQKLLGVNGDVITENQALMGTFGLTAEQVKNLTPKIIDLASMYEKSGMPVKEYSQYTEAVAKAINGNVMPFEKLVGKLGEAEKRSLEFGNRTQATAAMLKILQDRAAGAGETMGATFAGRLGYATSAFSVLYSRMGDVITRSGTIANLFGQLGDASIKSAKSVDESAEKIESAINFMAFNSTVAIGTIIKTYNDLAIANQRVVNYYEKNRELASSLFSMDLTNPVDFAMDKIREAENEYKLAMMIYDQMKTEKKYIDKAAETLSSKAVLNQPDIGDERKRPPKIYGEDTGAKQREEIIKRGIESANAAREQALEIETKIADMVREGERAYFDLTATAEEQVRQEYLEKTAMSDAYLKARIWNEEQFAAAKEMLDLELAQRELEIAQENMDREVQIAQEYADARRSAFEQMFGAEITAVDVFHSTFQSALSGLGNTIADSLVDGTADWQAMGKQVLKTFINIAFQMAIIKGLMAAFGVSSGGAGFGLMALFGSRGGSVPDDLTPRYYAKGGPVGEDRYPSWLARNEYVINADAMRQPGARAAAEMLNRGRIPAAVGSTVINETHNYSFTIHALDGKDLERITVERIAPILKRENYRGNLDFPGRR